MDTPTTETAAQVKTCTKCGVAKSTSEFSKGGTSKSGLMPRCKVCHSEYQRARYRNGSELKEYQRNYKRERRHSDPDFLMAHEMRRMVQRTLAASEKTSSSQNLLGYSPQELRTHIEAQFKPGMSWEDRSAWHIDHVKPVSAFIAEGITDPKIINALSNLSPLWARDNIIKGARYQ